jgi:hypothetical protein
MKYTADIQSAMHDPRQLEELYQLSISDNGEAEFRADLQSEFEKSPENLLLSAWRARFEHQPLLKSRRVINWGLAVILGIITGLILWAISDPKLLFVNQIPYYALLWAPIATIPTMIFLTVVSKKNYLYAILAAIVLALASMYILLISPGMASIKRNDYLLLMAIQLPVVCWIGIGITTLKFFSTADDRFAFLIKSIEVMIAAGVYLVFGGMFGGITLGMFSALNITPPDIIMRLGMAGGFGLIPILAVATMYDPHYSPKAQDFNLGLSKFVFTIVRLLLPLTLLVLVIYIFVIPFNFMEPFKNRNLLIIYNVMQFAIVGLLIGATPLKVDDLSQRFQTWLRRGIIAVVILALVISLYALAAVTYRTVLDILTLNRTTIIGWNVINIVILVALLVSQFRKGSTVWHERLQNIFSKAATAYLVWSLLLIVFLPLIFR